MTEHTAPARLCGAALPVELQLSARRLASGGTGRAGASARLQCARPHRRMLARRRRARAWRRQGMRPAADHRQRNPPRRRPAAGAARHRPRRLRQSVRAHHPRQAPRRERPLPPRSQRPGSGPARLPRPARAGGGVRCFTGALARRALSRARLDRRGTAVRRDDKARLAALRALGEACALPLVAAGDVHMHVRSRRGCRTC